MSAYLKSHELTAPKEMNEGADEGGSLLSLPKNGGPGCCCALKAGQAQQMLVRAAWKPTAQVLQAKLCATSFMRPICQLLHVNSWLRSGTHFAAAVSPPGQNQTLPQL